MNNAKTFPASLPLLLVVLFFLAFAYPGLRAYFTGDDLMNLQKMHGYFTTSPARVALEVFNPLSSSYRPMGGLFYRALYAAAGFHPFPFRCACFALLLTNLWIAYRLLHLLSASSEAALLGTLVLSYHAEMYGIYFNTGTVYDILCFTFLTLAMTVYVRCRRKFGGLSWQGWASLVVLDLLALQSKEMAWTLPAILLLYEVLYFWVDRQFRLPDSLAPVLATGLLTLAPLFSRILGRTGLTSSPLYHPSLSPGYFLKNCAHYWSLIFYAPDRIGVTLMLAMWIAMALAAALFRSRAMWFGLLFWIVSMAPVAVIQPRGGYVLYLPMLGLALYAGTLTSRLRELLTTGRVSQVCLFVLLAAGLAMAHARHRAEYAETVRVQSETRELVVQLRHMHPTLARNAHVLFVADPFGDEWFRDSSFACQRRPQPVGGQRRAPPARAAVPVCVPLRRRQAGGVAAAVGRLYAATLPAGLTDDASPLLCWDGDWITERFPQSSRVP